MSSLRWEDYSVNTGGVPGSEPGRFIFDLAVRALRLRRAFAETGEAGEEALKAVDRRQAALGRRQVVVFYVAQPRLVGAGIAVRLRL